MLTMEGRCGGGIAWQDSFKHIHVSLDTRLPASYGPGTNHPPQLQPQDVHTYKDYGCMSAHSAEGVPYLTSGP